MVIKFNYRIDCNSRKPVKFPRNFELIGLFLNTYNEINMKKLFDLFSEYFYYLAGLVMVIYFWQFFILETAKFYYYNVEGLISILAILFIVKLMLNKRKENHKKTLYLLIIIVILYSFTLSFIIDREDFIKERKTKNKTVRYS